MNITYPPYTGCGVVTEIGDPQTVTKWTQIYGSWMPDLAKKSSSRSTSGPFWILSNFEENQNVQEYADFRSLVRKRPSATYELPYEWAGERGWCSLIFINTVSQEWSFLYAD